MVAENSVVIWSFVHFAVTDPTACDSLDFQPSGTYHGPTSGVLWLLPNSSMR